MTNINATDIAKSMKVYQYPLSEIKENSDNIIYPMTDIQSLANQIELSGLLTPLTAYRSNNKLYLLSGHRRKQALTFLFNEGIKVFFNGIEIDADHVPVFISDKKPSQEEELRNLMMFNSHRKLEKEERLVLYPYAEKVYDDLCSEGRRPIGRKNEFISSLVGVSRRTYDNDIKTDEDIAEEESTQESKTNVSSDNSEYKQAMKQLTKIQRFLDDLDLSIFDRMEYRNLKDQLNRIDNSLSRFR